MMITVAYHHLNHHRYFNDNHNDHDIYRILNLELCWATDWCVEGLKTISELILKPGGESIYCSCNA